MLILLSSQANVIKKILEVAEQCENQHLYQKFFTDSYNCYRKQSLSVIYVW